MGTRVALLIAPILALAAGFAAPAFPAELLTTTPRALPTPNAGGVLAADEAFALNTLVEADGDLVLSWEMPPAFYLYRKSLKLEQGGVELPMQLPEGTQVSDEFFGESEVYFDKLLARVPAAALQAGPGARLELQLSYQGCLEDVYCYPPQHKSLSVILP